MTRTGKIARLPLAVRTRLNRNLADGVPGVRLVEWPSSLPEVVQVLTEQFDGRAINEPNLSEWKAGPGLLIPPCGTATSRKKDENSSRPFPVGIYTWCDIWPGPSTAAEAVVGRWAGGAAVPAVAGRTATGALLSEGSAKGVL